MTECLIDGRDTPACRAMARTWRGRFGWDIGATEWIPRRDLSWYRRSR